MVKRSIQLPIDYGSCSPLYEGKLSTDKMYTYLKPKPKKEMQAMLANATDLQLVLLFVKSHCLIVDKLIMQEMHRRKKTLGDMLKIYLNMHNGHDLP